MSERMEPLAQPWGLSSFLQGAVPKGNATKEFIESLQLKPGQVVYKCPKCCSIKPDRAHHCRYTWATELTCTRTRVHTHTCTHASPTRPPERDFWTSPALGTEWPWSLSPDPRSSLDGKEHLLWAQDTYLKTWLCHTWLRTLGRPLTLCLCVQMCKIQEIPVLPTSQLYFFGKGTWEKAVESHSVNV